MQRIFLVIVVYDKITDGNGNYIELVIMILNKIGEKTAQYSWKCNKMKTEHKDKVAVSYT